MIPFTIVDNFLKDPETVVDFAKSLEYDNTDPSYPGKRTQCLSQINYNFFNNVINKFCTLFTDDTGEYHYEASMFFQLVENNFEHGVVHSDNSFTGIIYLNKNSEENIGTSVYRKKPGILVPNFYPEEKQNFILNKEYDNFINYAEKVNSQFIKTIDVSGEYNRLFGFDGSEFHAANSYGNKNIKEPRLTLIFFIKKWYLPIPPQTRINRHTV